MKRISLLLSVIAFVFIACNNDPFSKEIKSLHKEIDDIHIQGMARMGQLNRLQVKVQQYIDSLDKLPEKAKTAAAGLRQQADSLLTRLDYADFAMNRWMAEFYSRQDTLAEKPQELLEYLQSEKLKAGKVTDAILGGIRLTDSLLDIKP